MAKYQLKPKPIDIVQFLPPKVELPEGIGCIFFLENGGERLQPGDYILTHDDGGREIIPKRHIDEHYEPVGE